MNTHFSLTNYPVISFGLLGILLLSSVLPSMSEDIAAANFPAFEYDRPEEQLPPVAGRLFSYVAIGNFTGGETPWLILSTQGHGSGTSCYQLNQHPQYQWIAGPGQPLNLPSSSPQTMADWDGDGTDDLIRAEGNTIRVYLMTPGTKQPTPRKTFILQDEQGSAFKVRASHLAVIFRAGVPELLISGSKESQYYPGKNGQQDEDISLGGGYDKYGVWRGEIGIGFVYYFRNTGTAESPVFAQGRALLAGRGYVSAPLNAYVSAADWTGDALFDLIVADFNGQFHFYKNIGTADRPLFELGVPLRNRKGVPVMARQCMARSSAYEWNHDNQPDLITGTEDGFVYVMLCTGHDIFGNPEFDEPQLIRGIDATIDNGVLTVQSFCDWNSDGDRDIVIGNAGGEILLIENAGTDFSPQYKLAQPLFSEGKPLRIMAMANGSPQGPNEATWGYACPSVIDWNGDKHLDLIVGDISGFTTVYTNDGNNELDGGHRLLIDGQEYKTVWRVRPVPIDWDNDGALEVIYMDRDSRLGVHEQGEDSWTLKPLQPFRYLDGSPIQLDGTGGMEGRCKLCVIDWDGDGDLDILSGLKGGTPIAEWTGSNSKIIWLERVNDINGIATFLKPKTLGTQEGPFPLGDHTLCPVPYLYPGELAAKNLDADGDGFNINPRIQYLTLTSEDGRLYRIDRNKIRVIHDGEKQ